MKPRGHFIYGDIFVQEVLYHVHHKIKSQKCHSFPIIVDSNLSMMTIELLAWPVLTETITKVQLMAIKEAKSLSIIHIQLLFV